MAHHYTALCITIDQLADQIPHHPGLVYMVELDDSDDPSEVYVVSMPWAQFGRDGVVDALRTFVRERLGRSLAVFVTDTEPAG